MASSSFGKMTRMMDYFTYIGIGLLAFSAVLACTGGCNRRVNEHSGQPPPSGSTPVATPPGGSAPAAPPAGPCRADADCGLVDDGCCGCNEGGRRTAMLAARR